MKSYRIGLVILAAIVGGAATDLYARGGFGGGGHGGGSHGGGGHQAAARPAARPASRPAPRPSASHLGGGHSSSRPNVSRPSASRPSVSRPAVSRPATSHPSYAQRPSGGLKPSTRPSTLPSHNISKPSTRPSTLPGSGKPGGNLAGNRPTTRPSVPNLGGGSGNRPNVGLPNRPDAGNRPGQGIANRPGGNTRPGGNFPNRPGAGGRPSPGDVGDFLGMDRPLRPETLPGTVRPGGDRPNLARPGGAGSGTQRPGLRPDGDRPGIVRPGSGGSGMQRPGFERPLRPGNNNRPINIDNVHVGNNNVINRRPTWNNIDRNKINSINNRWQNQLGGIRNWDNRHPNRAGYWRGWGDGVRRGRDYGRFGNCFGPGWWGNHNHGWCGWHYGYGFNRYPWSYWWTYPTFAGCVGWFNWSAPSAVWSQPVYYDYGAGGNVVYQDNDVYIDGQPVATADDFAQSAMALATVPPPANEEEAANVEWMPLGTFAVSSSKEDVEPTRVIQLAVSKTGIISGTLFNTKTDQSQSVQGQVDKDTQRVAFRVGESQNIVVETGLYNLTQAEAPVLVHFGEDKVEDWLLVRLNEPEQEES